jgi:hypothetical protein
VLRLIVTGIFAFFAVIAGVVIAFGVMLLGGLIRLFGGKSSVRASVNMNRPPRSVATDGARSPHRHDPNVIDVEATAIPPEPRRELEK